jgi:hypothetical protein
MYLFNRTHIVYERCRHEPHLFKAETRMDALVYVARKNKYSDLPLLERFIESRKPIIIDRLANNDPRLEKIEKNELTSFEMLDLGIQIGAIKEMHLEKFIAKADDYVYSLVSIDVE